MQVNLINKEKNHATLSASSSHRWLNCTPSARHEEKFENIPSDVAKEGTAAHELCEYKVLTALGKKLKKTISSYNCDEMEEYTDSYMNYVLEELEIAKENCKDPIILIEQRLDFSNYVTNGFGTGDCLIVSDDKLHIIDFKYGKGVLVDSNNNPQMMLYALGALNIYESIYDIKNVKMTIFQPRRENISSFEISVDELKKWAEGELKEKANLAYKGEGDFKCGDWCRFCRASTTCRKRAEEKLKLLKHEFKKPDLLEVLRENKIKATLAPTPREASHACGVSIYLYNKEDISKITPLCKKNNIEIDDIFESKVEFNINRNKFL